MLAAVPRGTAVVVTADHGQVHVADDVTPLAPEVATHVGFQSGEARFRWLHAQPRPPPRDLLAAAAALHGDRAWVATRDELIDAGWFGPMVTDAARARYGDVALVAKGTAAFTEPTDTGPYHLVGRHGSATPAELDVPLLVAVQPTWPARTGSPGRRFLLPWLPVAALLPVVTWWGGGRGCRRCRPPRGAGPGRSRRSATLVVGRRRHHPHVGERRQRRNASASARTTMSNT